MNWQNLYKYILLLRNWDQSPSFLFHLMQLATKHINDACPNYPKKGKYFKKSIGGLRVVIWLCGHSFPFKCVDTILHGFCCPYKCIANPSKECCHNTFSYVWDLLLHVYSYLDSRKSFYNEDLVCSVKIPTPHGK